MKPKLVNKCNICNNLFTRGTALRRHISTIHVKKSYFGNCANCAKKFYRKDSLIRHVRHCEFHWKWLDTSYICAVCDRSYNKKRELQRHISRSHMQPRQLCVNCGKMFNDKAGLVRHLHLCDPYNTDGAVTFVCDFCGRSFFYKYALLRHIIRRHMEDAKAIQKNVTTKKCVVCDASFFTKYEILNHLFKLHNIQIKREFLNFKSEEEFDIWRETMQITTGTFYKHRSRTNRNQRTSIYFQCRRFGPSTSNRTRRGKPVHSERSTAYCPAEITLRVNNVEGSCDASYVSTHLGHYVNLIEEVAPAFPTNEESTPVTSEISNEKISIDNKLSTSVSNTDPSFYSNNKYLLNVSQSCDVKQEPKSKSEEDLSNMETFLIENNESILFYKKQGDLDEKYSSLHEEDVIIVLMTQVQKEMLLKYGHKVIAVDETFCLSCYNFLLHTFFVIDNYHEGIPILFVISNRNDEIITKIVLETIVEKVGVLNVQIFMSDVRLAYINTWEKIMGKVKFRVFCNWRVYEAWRKNLSRIKNKSKREITRRKLYELSMILDEKLFDSRLQELIGEKDAELREFFKCFIVGYIDSCKYWAYCYQQNGGINTNMYAESFDRCVKSLIGKLDTKASLAECLKQLDVFMRSKELELRRKETKGKVSSKLQILRNRHEEFETKLNNLETEVECFPDADGNEWDVCISDTSKNTVKMYRVRISDEICDKCNLYCEKCEACLYAYQCTCIENSIKNSMCNHIHAVCTLLKTQNPTNAPKTMDNFIEEVVLPERSELPVDDQELNIDSNTGMVTGRGEEDESIKLHNLKLKILNEVLKNVNNLNTVDECELMYKQVKPMASIIEDARLT